MPETRYGRWTWSSTPPSSRSRVRAGHRRGPWPGVSGRSCGRGAAAPTRSSAPAGFTALGVPGGDVAGLAAAIERAVSEWSACAAGWTRATAVWSSASTCASTWPACRSCTRRSRGAAGEGAARRQVLPAMCGGAWRRCWARCARARSLAVDARAVVAHEGRRTVSRAASRRGRGAGRHGSSRAVGLAEPGAGPGAVARAGRRPWSCTSPTLRRARCWRSAHRRRGSSCGITATSCGRRSAQATYGRLQRALYRRAACVIVAAPPMSGSGSVGGRPARGGRAVRSGAGAAAGAAPAAERARGRRAGRRGVAARVVRRPACVLQGARRAAARGGAGHYRGAGDRR